MFAHLLMTTFTVQYVEDNQTTYDYLDARNRAELRRVFFRLHPKARILVVREN